MSAEGILLCVPSGDFQGELTNTYYITIIFIILIFLVNGGGVANGYSLDYVQQPC